MRLVLASPTPLPSPCEETLPAGSPPRITCPEASFLGLLRAIASRAGEAVTPRSGGLAAEAIEERAPQGGLRVVRPQPAAVLLSRLDGSWIGLADSAVRDNLGLKDWREPAR